MRDLSKTSLVKKKPIGRKLFFIGFVIVAVAGVLFILKSLGVGGTSGGVVLRDAQTNLKPVSVSQSDDITKGVNLKTEKATLKDVRGSGDSSGSATRAFGGGVYSLSVQATLPDPKNTYYQVWLVGSGGTVPVDFMTGSKTSWSLNLRDSDKFSKYNSVLITLERTKDDIPEEHVLEGSF